MPDSDVTFTHPARQLPGDKLTTPRDGNAISNLQARHQLWSFSCNTVYRHPPGSPDSHPLR